MEPLPRFYNCSNCPAYCCSYPHIIAGKRDIARLAKHFGLTPEAARKKFTKPGANARQRVLRHQHDKHFGTVCRFLDTESRECTVHAARPKICRDYPGARRCGYYDFLCFERNAQEDPDYVVEVIIT